MVSLAFIFCFCADTERNVANENEVSDIKFVGILSFKHIAISYNLYNPKNIFNYLYVSQKHVLIIMSKKKVF